MKKRLISVAVALVLLAAVLILYDTVFVNIVFVLLGGLAIFEGLRALGMGNNVLFVGGFIVLHVVNMFFSADPLYTIYLALFLMFCLVMFDKEHRYTFKAGAGALAMFIMVTMGLTSILRMRAMATLIGDKIFMLMMGLALGWICDIFAFSVGSLFGKRKMCEHISPNKTIAGGVGGVVGNIIVITLVFYIYSIKSNPQSLFHGMNDFWHIVAYIVIAALGAIIGIIGDLAGSFIKRECGIKDFGTIMPGHGGALDRLDSVLFTSTFAFYIFSIYFRLFATVI